MFTFYIKHRERRVPVGGLNKWPSDWLDVRNGILESAKEVFRKFHLVEEVLFLERHLKGRSFLGTVDYRQTKIPYRRRREGVFKVEFYPKLEYVDVKPIYFGYSLSFLRPQFLLLEKNRLPNIPPLIPRAQEKMLNSDKFLVQMSGPRYGGSYQRGIGGSYNFELRPFETHGSYQRGVPDKARAVV